MISSTPEHLPADTRTGPASASKVQPLARLTRLQINQFRHVARGTVLHFDHGINVLLGRNGTGKTTMLELIVAITRGDLRKYRGEAFDLEFELLLGGESVKIAARNTTIPPKEPTEFFSKESFEWSYEIDYEDAEGSQYHIEASKNLTRLSGPNSSSFPEASLFNRSFYESCLILILNLDATNFPGFRYQFRRLAKSSFRLDEGLDVFRSITEGEDLPRIQQPLSAHLFSDYPRNNFEEATKRILELLMSYIPTPLLECLLSLGNSVHTTTEISASSEQWALLETFRGLIGARNARVTLSLVDRQEPSHGKFQSSFGKPIFRVTSHHGTTFNHDKFSYGEKRLLIFLYHAAANPQILVADELVNGLHYEWIQACLDAIKGQAFLSSQNPLLLDHLPFSSAEEAQRRFVLCDRDGAGNWTWRNMDDAEASSFHRAYEVGVQHVSGILRTKGLW